MTQPLFDTEQMASEWANRVCSRLAETGLASEELEETRLMIQAFTKTAADELNRDRSVVLPYTDQVLEIQAEQAHQIIELFLRGINHVAKKLRDTGKSWDERRPVLESMAWKLFNLAKLLTGFTYIPNPGMQNVFNGSKDVQLMMKQSAEVILEDEISGTQSGLFPFLNG